jgi:hypothetical protein
MCFAAMLTFSDFLSGLKHLCRAHARIRGLRQ